MTSENEGVLSIVEIETLLSIYVNELEVENDEAGLPESVALWLFPATADNIEKQYVRLRLIFKLSNKYPNDIPEITICNARGLSDEQINRIYGKLTSIAEDCKGSAMLYELIEAAKEQLTSENRPSENCAICLYEFVEEDVFTKTECYHYFHSHCLNSYVQWKVNDVSDEDSEADPKTLCPVCRVPITFKYKEEGFPEPVAASLDSLEIPRQQRDEMNHLYQKQLAQGGIINVEEEKNKFFLEISNISNVNNSDANTATPSSKNKTTSTTKVINGTKESSQMGSSKYNTRRSQGGYQAYRRNKDYGPNSRYQNNRTRQNYKDEVSGDIGIDELRISNNARDTDKSYTPENACERNSFRGYHHNRFRSMGGRQRQDSDRTKYHYNDRSNRPYRNYSDRESNQREQGHSIVDEDRNGMECSLENEAASGERNIPSQENSDHSLQNVGVSNSEKTFPKRFPGNFPTRPNYRNRFPRDYSDPQRPRNWHHDPSSKEFEESPGEGNYRHRPTFQHSYNYPNRKPQRYGHGYGRPPHSNVADGRPETSHSHSSNSYHPEKPRFSNYRGHPHRSFDQHPRNEGRFKSSFPNEVQKSNSRCNDISNRETVAENPSAHSHARNGEAFGVPNCSRSSDNSVEKCGSNVGPPPGFANPHKKVVYGLPSVNPPPGFSQS